MATRLRLIATASFHALGKHLAYARVSKEKSTPTHPSFKPRGCRHDAQASHPTRTPKQQNCESLTCLVLAKAFLLLLLLLCFPVARPTFRQQVNFLQGTYTSSTCG